MDYAALADTILAHPLTWVAVTFVAAPLVAFALNLQLKSIGLGRRIHQRGIAWNLVLSFLVFWLVLLGGLMAVAGSAEIEALSWPLSSLFHLLLSLVPAALLLGGAAHYRRARLEEARDEGKEAEDGARSELRWVGLAVGVLAAIAVMNGPVLVPLLLLAVPGLALWWIVSPKARARTRAWRQGFAAGKRLRDTLAAGDTVEAPQGSVSLVGPVGLISTDVLEGGQLRPMANAELLERVVAGEVVEEVAKER